MAPAAMIAPEPGGIAGHITSLGHEPHHYSIFYVDVDDVASYLHKGQRAGGPKPGIASPELSSRPASSKAMPWSSVRNSQLAVPW